MTNLNSTNFPFIRHYKDYHRYKVQGNIFLNTTITFKKLNIQRIQLAIENLVKSCDILRTYFKYNNDQLQFLNKPYNGELYIPKMIIDHYENRVESTLNKTDIEKDELIKFYLLPKQEGTYELQIYVHHIICNGSSLRILKSQFIDHYKGLKTFNKQYQFKEYSIYKNKKIWNEYNRTYAFYKNYIPKYIHSNAQTPKDYSQMHYLLSKQSYYVIQDTTLTVALSYTSFHDLGLTQAKHRYQLIIKHKVTLSSIFLTAYSHSLASYFGKEILIGLLFDDRYSKNSQNLIGELTGESIFKVSQVKNTSINQIKQVNMLLFNLARNLIFNYNLYSLNEEDIYKKCIGFFNFTVDNTDSPYYTYKSDFKNISHVGLPVEPIMTLYKNGIFNINWRFNETFISKKELLKLEEKFISTITSIFKNLN